MISDFTYSNKYSSQIKFKFNIIHIHILLQKKLDIKPTKSYKKSTMSQNQNIIHILTNN